MPQGFLCVAGHQVVAPKSPAVVCWPAIGPWQSAIGVAANHKPQHNWRGFGRHYMGTSNTQGPLWHNGSLNTLAFCLSLPPSLHLQQPNTICPNKNHFPRPSGAGCMSSSKQLRCPHCLFLILHIFKVKVAAR